MPSLRSGEGVLVVREHVEELLPGPHHELLGLVNLPIAINEDMVIRHEEGRTIQVPRVDALVELQSDQEWILRVHPAATRLLTARSVWMSPTISSRSTVRVSHFPS